MVKIRRWYIFVVSAISLNVVIWGIIALLRNLFARGLNASKTQIALQIAIIIIGLPFYLGHWLWAQRLAEKDAEERRSNLRSFYLYGMMVSFLAPFAINAFSLIDVLVRQILSVERPRYTYPQLPLSELILFHLVALVVLALFWFYHYRLVSSESAPQTDGRATARRIYIYGFSAVGLTLSIIGLSTLLNWVLFQFGDNVPSKSGLPTIITQLLLGIPLWVIFWRQGQRLFYGSDEAEQESVLRKLYLYVAVFVGVITAVTTTTVLFAAWLRGLLGLTTFGDIRDPLSIIVGSITLWVFHAYALQEDAAAATEHPRQAGIRRLYLYLVAGVGLGALLIGLAGEISILIRALAAGTTISNDLREGLALFTAALIAGLPVWLIPWQKVQVAAVSEPTSVDERRSLVRRIYLYFYLFVAAMTMLGSAIYIVSQLVELLLGVRDTAGLLIDLGHAIAFTLIAVGVWMVHWTTLRQDGRFLQEAESQKLKTLHVVVLDSGDNEWGAIMRDELSRELLQINLQHYNLITPQPTESEAQLPLIDALAQVDVIIGSWTMVVEKEVGADVATAVSSSPARKLLIPTQNENWDWVGVPRQNAEKTVKEIIHALKQIAAGEEVVAKRPLGIGSIIGIVIGGLLLFAIVMPPLLFMIIEQIAY